MTVRRSSGRVDESGTSAPLFAPPSGETVELWGFSGDDWGLIIPWSWVRIPPPGMVSPEKRLGERFNSARSCSNRRCCAIVCPRYPSCCLTVPHSAWARQPALRCAARNESPARRESPAPAPAAAWMFARARRARKSAAGPVPLEPTPPAADSRRLLARAQALAAALV